MSKVVCVLLVGGIFLCSADNMLVVGIGVIMLTVGMVLAKKWRL